MASKTQERKRSHLSLCADDEVSFQNKTTLLEQIELPTRALPELSLDQVQTTTRFAGREMAAPLFIGAMTGGTGNNSAFNRDLATVAGEKKIALCLGSLRPILEDKKMDGEFQVRPQAGESIVLGNLGGQQLLQYKLAEVLDALKRIEADGLVIHLNPAMELIQPWGDKDFSGIAKAISQLVDKMGDMPLVVKETGRGLSWKDGTLLKEAGVKVVEVAGAGGTSWVGVETLRAKDREQRMGQMLWDTGIPTAVTTAWMVDQEFSVISSGGVYTGLDMARALALGAHYTAVARPLVKAYRDAGIEGMREVIEDLITGLQYVMICVGAKNLEELRRVPRVMGPALSRYIETGWQSR